MNVKFTNVEIAPPVFEGLFVILNSAFDILSSFVPSEAGPSAFGFRH